MEVVKRKLVSARCAEERNRDGNECETDVALPNSSHTMVLLSNSTKPDNNLNYDMNLQEIPERGRPDLTKSHPRNQAEFRFAPSDEN
jgi:hypothetical protein